MLPEHVHNFQLTFLDDDVQSVGVELDSIWVLDVVIDEKTVRQTGSELEADFATQPKLEGLDEVAVDLDECVVLREHEFFLGFFLLRLFEHQFISECVGGRRWCLIHLVLWIRHIFDCLELLGGHRGGLKVRRQSVCKYLFMSFITETLFDRSYLRFPPMQCARHSASVSKRFWLLP